MDNVGGSYRFWGFGHRIQGKVSLLGVSAKTQSWLRFRLMGIAFGGVLSLLGLFVRFLHLTAFLLFVLNTRVLTIAHIPLHKMMTTCPKTPRTQRARKHIPRVGARTKSILSLCTIVLVQVPRKQISIRPCKRKLRTSACQGTSRGSGILDEPLKSKHPNNEMIGAS